MAEHTIIPVIVQGDRCVIQADTPESTLDKLRELENYVSNHSWVETKEDVTRWVSMTLRYAAEGICRSPIFFMEVVGIDQEEHGQLVFVREKFRDSCGNPMTWKMIRDNQDHYIDSDVEWEDVA